MKELKLFRIWANEFVDGRIHECPTDMCLYCLKNIIKK